MYIKPLSPKGACHFVGLVSSERADDYTYFKNFTHYWFCTFSVKAMLLIIDCKKKITWKKFDHIPNGSLVSSDGKVSLEEKELIKVVDTEEGLEKVNDDEVMHN